MQDVDNSFLRGLQLRGSSGSLLGAGTRTISLDPLDACLACMVPSKSTRCTVPGTKGLSSRLPSMALSGVMLGWVHTASEDVKVDRRWIGRTGKQVLSRMCDSKRRCLSISSTWQDGGGIHPGCYQALQVFGTKANPWKVEDHIANRRLTPTMIA